MDAAIDPWRPECLLKIAQRAEGTEGKPTLKLVLNGRSVKEAFVRATFGYHRIVDEYDVVVAWRCRCPYNWKVTYHTLDDLPDGLGYHAACPICGASPLEVVE